jgi:hypothetical protein
MVAVANIHLDNRLLRPPYDQSGGKEEPQGSRRRLCERTRLSWSSQVHLHGNLPFRYREASPRPSDRSEQASTAGDTPAALSPPASAGAHPRSSLRVMRPDRRQKTTSGQRRTYLGQEPVAPRHLLLHRIKEAGKGGLLLDQKSSSHALFKSVGSCRKQQVFQTFPDMKAAASSQNQRPRPYQPPPPIKTTMRTMMRIVVKSMNFSPVGALAATAAQDEQSISHDWHSTEHYGAFRCPALTLISAEALEPAPE